MSAQSVFEVKDKTGQDKGAGNQQTLEFEVTSSDNWMHEVSKGKSQADMNKASQRVNMIKKAQERMKEIAGTSSNTGDIIDELENTPAYKRKKVKIEEVKHSEETKVSAVFAG